MRFYTHPIKRLNSIGVAFLRIASNNHQFGYVLAFLATLATFTSSGQSIQKRTASADIVFEGRVISSNGFWNEPHTRILTSNLVEVFKSFKGESKSDTIEVVSQGGVTEDAFLEISHTTHLASGMEGLFFCAYSKIKQTNSKYQQCELLIGENNFIQYHQERFNPQASDHDQQYNDIPKEVYMAVEQSSKQPTKLIRPNSRELKLLEMTGTAPFGGPENEITIEYSFENVQIVSLTEIQFDIFAKTNQAGNGSGFGEAEIFVKYNPVVFGSYVVANNKLEVSKGTIVQNNIYQLNTTDVNNETVKIAMKGGCKNYLNAFSLSTTAQQLCTINLTIQDLSQLANIAYDDFQMAGQSKYVKPNQNGCISFDKVIVGNPIKNFQSESPVEITYTMENFDTAGIGFSESLEFDIFASASISGTEYVKADIFLDYSNFAFASSIFGAGDLVVTKGTLLQNASYVLSASDDDFNTFRLSISANDLNDLNSLPIIPVQVAHVRMFGKNCNQEAGISFDEPNMEMVQFHFVGGIFSFEMYEPVSASTTYNQPACSNDIPFIMSFTEPVVAAGIGDTITIKGRNFRNTQGKISFRNADMETEIYTTALDIDVSIWQDTLIKVHVPSTTVDNGTAGTGQIIVENIDGYSRKSDSTLTVKYSVRNKLNTDGYPYRASLIDQNGEGGYTFLVDSFLLNQPDGVSCIEKAMLDWSCATGVTWKIGGGTTHNFQSSTDNQNVIFWEDELPDSILALTYLSGGRITDCVNNLSEGIFYAKDIDIAINSKKLWGWDCNQPPVFYDFYSVVLHELGHAHMLGHALHLPKVMYPVTNFAERVILTGLDIEGGQDVMAYGEDNLNGTCPPYNDPDIPTGCTNPIFEIENELQQLEVQLFPNPFGETVTLEVDILGDNEVQLSTFDILGRKVHQSIFHALSGKTSFSSISLGNDLKPGVYYLEIRVDGTRLSKKLVKL